MSDLVRRLRAFSKRKLANHPDALIDFPMKLSEAREAADALERGWVPVSERLPEQCYVLVCWEDGYIEEIHASSVEAYTHRVTSTGQIVTHWMPLPSPPAKREVP